MAKTLMLVCCGLSVALLWSAVTANGGAAIDFAAIDDERCLVLDDEGMVWSADTLCNWDSASGYSYPGACALDYCRQTEVGLVVFPNGDMQPIYPTGNPWPEFIEGPPGASNVESVKMLGDGNGCVIRSGCLFWQYSGGDWYGPCDPLGGGASAAEQETWGEIKAEFGEGER